MAIDSREKRQAAAHVGSSPIPPTPTPRATADVEWRQEAGWGYPGIVPITPFVRLPGQTWAKTNPTDQEWTKTQPTDQSWTKSQPDDQIWSTT